VSPEREELESIATATIPGGDPSFGSILFPPADHPRRSRDDAAGPPGHFRDLNLDQLVEDILVGWQDYELASVFYDAPLSLDTIAYRQAVFRDLEDDAVAAAIATFADGMRAMRRALAAARQTAYAYERERWMLGAAAAYCDGAERLAETLQQLPVRSGGMAAFRAFLVWYVASGDFQRLAKGVRTVLAELSAIRYGILITGGTVAVLPYGGEADYSAVVEGTFAKFRQGNVKDYRVKIAEGGALNHVEALVLDGVAQLHPTAFAALDAFCVRHSEFASEILVRFDREVQFYRSYLAFLRRLRRTDLAFCYPVVSTTSKAIAARDAFDAALASKLLPRGERVVRNDFQLCGDERVFVVTGSNQGGKTTFARMVAQMHYLASLGCLVPGTEARLFLFDRLFVNFERPEDLLTLRGKLQADLVRMHAILSEATPSSLVILNEVFSSTTAQDAEYLTRRILGRIVQLDLLAVCVTFLDDIASCDRKTVSLVSRVDPRRPTVRTFKVERRPPDGLAYAVALAAEHHVTYEWLKRRMRP
jgi:DNA mismatch repair protein MutS